MGGDLRGVAQQAARACEMCGRAEEFFELPGRPEKLCLACSADIATAIVLRTEIDSATLAGQNANALVVEFAALSRELLARAQSADA
jgi:hypothetical protein